MFKSIGKFLYGVTALVAVSGLVAQLGVTEETPTAITVVERVVDRPTQAISASVEDSPYKVEVEELPTKNEDPSPHEVDVSVVDYKTADDVAESPNETIFTTMETQGGATWGLDLIDGNVDGSYTYTGDGSGVRIYIVDTGVDATHREFGSRVVDGFDAFGQNLDQTDCNGHGTHVAGIAAGSYYGVAKAATIVPVRVMDCTGRGNTTTLTEGIDWILASHPGGVGVVNMSLGGSKDSRVDSATEKLISAGLIVVAAAGNSDSDACSFSPASAYGVTGVGAVDRDSTKASFSNWGSCVDVSAPGVKINSANSLDHNVSLRMSGTSQAAPFVAGAIATYLSNGSVSTPSRAQEYLKELSVDGVLRVEAEPAPLPEPTPEPIVEPEPEPVEPEPSEPPVVDEPSLSDFYVTVSQVDAGSYDGILEWSTVDGASQYRIYKTSSLRPGWRLFWVEDQGWNYHTVVDKPGSIAIYKVIAVVGSEEIELGKFKYTPTK